MGKEHEQYEVLKNIYSFLNQQMKRFEKTAELQIAIDHLLESVGNYFSANVVQLYKRENGTHHLASEWSGEDSKVDKWDEWIERKIYQENFESEKKDYIVLEKNGNILFVIPLFDGDKLIAVLTIINPMEEKIGALTEIADMFGNWLANRLAKRDYLNRYNRIQKLLSGLGNDYTAVYIINLDTDAFETIINQQSNNVAKEQTLNDFSAYLDNYANKYVLEESREDMKRVLRYNYLKEHFKNAEDLYFRFHTLENSIGQTYFEAHAVRQYENGGHFVVIGFRCVDDIVKKEKKYQEELDKAYRNAQQQLEVITSSIPGGVKISYDDPEYSFKYVSKQYAQMLGYDSVEEFMEMSHGSIVGIAHPDDLENGIAEALDQYSRSDHYDITYRMRCKDGTWKYIEDHGHKVINTDGEVEHWNLILDKNELVQKTIELESAKKAEQVKNAFLSRMSHDIRTPLNGIIGLLEYADRHPNDTETISNNRKKAHVAAEHLLSLINDVLELNKLDDKNVRLVDEPFNFVDLMHNVKTISDMRASEQGISVFMEDKYFNIKNPYVFGSALHVKRIFINIITNAIKYNKIGGSVWCKVEERDIDSDKVEITVRVTDSGIGMSEKFLKHIYTPFTQASYDARTDYSGNGLGMSIAKNLVDRMNGTISIKSKEKMGTTVEVVLPFKKAKRSDLPPVINTEERHDLSGLKALLVEDNELNMEIAHCMLEDENVIVTEAYNGEEAVKLFTENPAGTYDIVLMDIMMPVMDGLTASRKIRESGKSDALTIPIFAMTANTFTEDIEASKNAGMNEHIAKPIEMKKLMGKIVQYCR